MWLLLSPMMRRSLSGSILARWKSSRYSSRRSISTPVLNLAFIIEHFLGQCRLTIIEEVRRISRLFHYFVKVGSVFAGLSHYDEG